MTTSSSQDMVMQCHALRMWTEASVLSALLNSSWKIQKRAGALGTSGGTNPVVWAVECSGASDARPCTMWLP